MLTLKLQVFARRRAESGLQTSKLVSLKANQNAVTHTVRYSGTQTVMKWVTTDIL